MKYEINLEVPIKSTEVVTAIIELNSEFESKEWYEELRDKVNYESYKVIRTEIINSEAYDEPFINSINLIE